MNKEAELNSRIYGCISTYDSLLEKSSVIIKIVDEFVDKVVKPLSKDLIFRITKDEPDKRRYKFEGEEWEKTKALIDSGKIKKLSFMHFDKKMIEALVKGIDCEEAHIFPELINLNILSNADSSKRASLIEFSINKWIYGGSIPQYVCLEFQKLIELVLSNIDCVGGLITVDTMGAYESFSSHERYVGLEYTVASENFNKYFRGYSWGNYLSKSHVELLGGIEKIQREAPVYLVKSLGDNGVFLQLTEDVNIVSDDNLRKLKKYLYPILPKAPRMLFPYEAGFRRIIIDEDDSMRFIQS